MWGKDRVSHVVFLSLLLFAVIVLIPAVLSAIVSLPTPNPAEAMAPTPVPCAPNAVAISILYSPEEDQYLPQVMADFNAAYINGVNPLTQRPLASNEPTICVTGGVKPAGEVRAAIVNAIRFPNNANVQRPTIWAPSVSHWMLLVNHDVGTEVFDMEQIQPTALAPVVIAIWESRLQAIRSTIGYDDIGWDELLDVLHSPNGWCDYGIAEPDCRRTVYYGHTNPYNSSTALSTLIAEFYASARANVGFEGRILTEEVVNDPAVLAGVRAIEAMIRHYADKTTEFKYYIIQGPDYVDFVALEENDLIAINLGLEIRGQVQYPPEPLVALYPDEGTFWHEHPFGVPNAPWVSQEQRAAASEFTEYVLSPTVQEMIMSFNFRPANPAVPLAYPIVEENGVSPAGPPNTLELPDVEVMRAIQEQWSFVAKQADIMLLIDISGSMRPDKLAQAQQAALTFLTGMEPHNRVGLAVFSDQVEIVVPIGSLEINEPILRDAIASLNTGGGTALFSAVTDTVNLINDAEDEGRIRAVVLLSDGADTSSPAALPDATSALQASQDSLNPIILIPIAYGSDADTQTLSSLAIASRTIVQSGNPDDIDAVMEYLRSFFTRAVPQ